jgi:hypothetical protein
LGKVFCYFVLAILLISTIETTGQGQVSNLPKYDHADYHFGFTIGLNQMLFDVKPESDINSRYYYEIRKETGELVADSAMVLGVYGTPTFGFNIGIVGDKRLGRYFNLRFVPSLVFGERYLNYSFKAWVTGEERFVEVKKNVGSVFIDFPLLLKYKSKRHNNMLAYLLVGAKYSLDIASNAKKKDLSGQVVVKLNKNDIYAIAGVGFDFYNPWFKLGVELKMSYGLMNVLKSDNTFFTQSIDKINSKVFELGLTFE